MKEFIKKHGYYIALGLCIITVFILGFALTAQMPEQKEEPAPRAEEYGSDVITIPREMVSTNSNSPIQPSPSPTPTPEKQGKVLAASKSDEGFIMPVEGKIIVPYSPDNLIYSKTMSDWRVHNGIDIASPLNTKVVAAADGMVEKVYTDDQNGITIVIDHGNALKSIYKNLSTNRMVKVGMKVKKGTPISGVGDTMSLEISEEPHLHFEVELDGKPADPIALIKQ